MPSVTELDHQTDLIDKVLRILPGTNCGVCGYPRGCAGYAEAYTLVRLHGGVLPNCPLGGEDVAKELRLVWAMMPDSKETAVITPICQGSTDVAKDRFVYAGLEDCGAAFRLWGGSRECRDACLGSGSCVRLCPRDALRLADGIPVVDEGRCDGCGECVSICPTQVLALLPRTQKVYLACRRSCPTGSREHICTRACDLCGICAQTCPYEAIRIADALPVIDPVKCRSCGVCVYQCPTQLFVDRVKVRPTSFIGTECDGCGLCLTWCTRGAILGKPNAQHQVDRKKCIGCGLCFERCPRKAVTMFGALGYARE